MTLPKIQQSERLQACMRLAPYFLWSDFVVSCSFTGILQNFEGQVVCKYYQYNSWSVLAMFFSEHRYAVWLKVEHNSPTLYDYDAKQKKDYK